MSALQKFLPDRSRTFAPPRLHLERAVFAKAFWQNGDAVKFATDRWPQDEATPLVLRGATAPATTTTSGWASQLAQTAVGDFIGSLGDYSAAARLISAGLLLPL